MNRILLGLGSNKSFDSKSPLELLRGACGALQDVPGLSDVRFSSVYKTRAMYVENQDDFYNMAAVCFADDSITPQELLQKIHAIEAQFGRDRTKEIRFGPRSLDIDIELFGNQKIATPELEIPHVRLKERAFVLVPAIEILDKSADKSIREEFISALNALKNQGKDDGIELFCAFERLASHKTEQVQAVQNGSESGKF